MDKLITFAVPSYNSQNYLKTCIESLLVGGNDVEIIIVNDGSTDKTAQIANEYAAKYPGIVRAVHKENGGHGSGVNKGLELATGLFYKVVDSDDWLDADALKYVLNTIKRHVKENTLPDLYIANFVYDHVIDNTQKVSAYRKNLPVDKFFGWEQTKPLHFWKMFLMHSLIYRTQLLKDSKVVLPEHTFYVDNVFAYKPLPYANKLYYMDVDLYHYYIGRSDQSVTVENLVKRYEQQIRCMKLIFKAHSYEEIKTFCRPLRKQLYHFLDSVMMNTYFFTTAKDTPERRRDFKEMWEEFKAHDKKLYKKLRSSFKVRILNCLNWKGKSRVTTKSYMFLCKHVKLGM